MVWLNLLALIAANVLFSAGLIAMGTHRRSRELVIYGLVALGLVVWVVYVAGPDVGRWFITPFQLGAVPGGLLMAAACWADVIGLPRPLALRLGVGLREPAVDLSNLIVSTNDRVFEELDKCVKDPRRAERHLADARVLVDRLAEHAAPDQYWGQVRDDYAACHRRALTVAAAMVSGLDGEDAAPGSELEAAYNRAAARLSDLNEALKEDRGGNAVTRRNGLAVGVGGAAAGLLVFGNAVLASRVSLPVHTDPWLWLKACVVGIAVWLALYLVVVAVLKVRR